MTPLTPSWTSRDRGLKAGGPAWGSPHSEARRTVKLRSLESLMGGSQADPAVVNLSMQPWVWEWMHWRWLDTVALVQLQLRN